MFSEEDQLRALSHSARGRLGGRLAATSVSADDPEETIVRVLHQFGHLYTVKVLGEDTPPWLEEGLAARFETITGRRWVLPRKRPVEQPSGLSLESVFGARSDLFSDDERGRQLRQASRDLVRFLDDGQFSFRPIHFQKFLASAVKGAPLDAVTLLRAMKMNRDELESKFLLWRERQDASRR